MEPPATQLDNADRMQRLDCCRYRRGRFVSMAELAKFIVATGRYLALCCEEGRVVTTSFDLDDFLRLQRGPLVATPCQQYRFLCALISDIWSFAWLHVRPVESLVLRSGKVR